MTDGQEYGKQIAEKMRDLTSGFRAELNEYNDYYRRMMNCNDNSDELAAGDCADSEEFIKTYLYTEAMELVKAILKADVYGMFTAGFVPFAKDPAEYRELEKKQTGEYYHDVNKTIADFTADLKKWSEPITE